MAVREIMREMFKGPTRPIPNTVTVATTVTDVLKNNPDRFGWLITNLSLNRGYLGFDREVSSSNGIPIEAQGGIVSSWFQEDGETTTYAIFGLNLVAAGVYYTVEFERF